MSLERTLSDMALNHPFTQPPPYADTPVFRSKISGQPLTRPSDVWLKNPGWIDGAVNPPRFYCSHEEMDEAIAVWGPITGIQAQPRLPGAIDPSERDYEIDRAMARISPTPVPTAAALAALEDTAPALGPSDVGVDPAAVADEAQQPKTVASAPNLQDLHVIRSTFTFPAPLVPGAKPVKKPHSVVKVFNIDMSKTSRVEFVKASLLAHGVSHSFSPGLVSGPAFKIYWTGSAGGKANAASILVDTDFDINKAALFRKKQKPEVCMEFTSMDLEAFRIQDVAAQAISLGPSNPGLDEQPELAYGTHVPQVSAFSTSSQLHGMYILELKQKWKCEQHLGEHGEQGYCYVAPSGDHLRLNPYRLKLWSAAWAAGDATKHEPPNLDTFDGHRNAAGPSVRPRGRAGIHAPTVDSTNGNNQLMALLVGALLPTLGGMTRKHGREESVSPRGRQYRTPPRPSTSTLAVVPPLSPLPPSGTEIDACLANLLEKEGVDFTLHSSVLQELDLTPDIIPAADNELLMDILGATIGKVLKLKIFCTNWNARHVRKQDVFSA